MLICDGLHFRSLRPLFSIRMFWTSPFLSINSSVNELCFVLLMNSLGFNNYKNVYLSFLLILTTFRTLQLKIKKREGHLSKEKLIETMIGGNI